MMALKQGLLVLLKIAACLILIYLIVIAVIVYILSPDHDIFKKDKFDKALWSQDIEAGNVNNKLDCQRGRMAQDVIDNVLSKKLSRDDVIHILGEPNTSKAMEFDYKLGWCTYMDPNSLRIEFDENNFLKAYILNH